MLHPRAPPGITEIGRGVDEGAQSGHVECEDEAVGVGAAAGVVVDAEGPGAAGFDAGHRGGGPDARAVALEIPAERSPQGGVEVAGGDVEQQALRGAEEVDVEHRGQLGGRHPGRGREEAAREHLEREVIGRLRKTDALQEGLGVDVVEPVVDLRHGHGRERGRGPHVDAHQILQPERGTAQREHQCVPRWGVGNSAKGVAPARAVDERIVVDRRQPLQIGVGPSQQPAQVVVLPEEGVEPAVHGESGAVVETFTPAADPSAQVRLAFEHLDFHAALGERGGGGQSCDAGADDHHAGPLRQMPGVGRTPGGGVVGDPRVAADGTVHVTASCGAGGTGRRGRTVASPSLPR